MQSEHELDAILLDRARTRPWYRPPRCAHGQRTVCQSTIEVDGGQDTYLVYQCDDCGALLPYRGAEIAGDAPVVDKELARRAEQARWGGDPRRTMAFVAKAMGR